VILAGPNGAGKSTAAPGVLRGALGVDDFVNADVIAQGLSAFDPESAAVEAGRVMLSRLDDLAARGRPFAFETTLAGRAVLRRIERWQASGYAVHLVYLWLPSAELAVERVRIRVAAGGHAIPGDVIRRRYARSVVNFDRLYRTRVTTWHLYDSSSPDVRPVIAHGAADTVAVVDSPRWLRVQEQARTLARRLAEADHE